MRAIIKEQLVSSFFSEQNDLINSGWWVKNQQTWEWNVKNENAGVLLPI